MWQTGGSTLQFSVFYLPFISYKKLLHKLKDHDILFFVAAMNGANKERTLKIRYGIRQMTKWSFVKLHHRERNRALKEGK
jgi:hypothetical protein